MEGRRAVSVGCLGFLGLVAKDTMSSSIPENIQKRVTETAASTAERDGIVLSWNAHESLPVLGESGSWLMQGTNHRAEAPERPHARLNGWGSLAPFVPEHSAEMAPSVLSRGRSTGHQKPSGALVFRTCGAAPHTPSSSSGTLPMVDKPPGQFMFL